MGLQTIIFSGFPDMPADCFPSPFLCYKPVEGIMTPTMRSYKPRVRLMGNGKYSRAKRPQTPLGLEFLKQAETKRVQSR